MKFSFSLAGTLRTNLGKGASRRLRRTDRVPGIVYGAGKDPVAIEVDHNELVQLLKHEAVYASVLGLELSEIKEAVILRDLQRHPYKPKILHLDLQRVSSQEQIVMRIPLRFVGEDVAPGVKVSGGLISHLLSDVEVSCLPEDLPDFIEVDLSALEINQTIHLSDLKLPNKISLVSLAHGEDSAVATAYLPREQTDKPIAAADAAVDAAISEAEKNAAEKKGKDK
jgi:ribosomal protein L25, Ctc-form